MSPPERESDRRTGAALSSALALYAIWVLATYLLEGRQRTLLRPDAQGLRLAYTAVANVAVGIAGSAFIVRRLVARRILAPERAGFRSLRRTLLPAIVGLGSGLAFFWVQRGAGRASVVVLNVLAQVWPVSTAEILVCWAVAGAVVHAIWPGPARGLVASLVASVLFGLYHFAHSPPFNSFRMVGLMTGVGLATSLFFFLVRDVYGTIAFHNGLAVVGVIDALDRSGEIPVFERPIVALWVTAVVSVVLLAALHLGWFRPGSATGPEPPGPAPGKRR